LNRGLASVLPTCPPWIRDVTRQSGQALPAARGHAWRRCLRSSPHRLPIYRQIVEQSWRPIAGGRLPSDERLPSVRDVDLLAMKTADRLRGRTSGPHLACQRSALEPCASCRMPETGALTL